MLNQSSFNENYCRQFGYYNDCNIGNDYISDNITAMSMLQQIYQINGLFGIMMSKPGTGKTKAIQKVIQKDPDPHHLYIYVCPTKLLAKQIAYDLECPAFLESETNISYKTNVFVCIMDKLKTAYYQAKQISKFNKITLIIDEAHDTLMLQSSFRSIAVNHVRSVLLEAQKYKDNVLMISATPASLSCFPFNYILDIKSTKNNINMIEIRDFNNTYDQRHDIRNFEYETAAIMSEVQSGNKVIVCLNDKEDINIVKNELSRYSINSLVLSADTLNLKSTNQKLLCCGAESLYKQGILPVQNESGQTISVYFCTTAINTGINIIGYDDGIQYSTTPMYFVTKKTHMNTDAIIQFWHRIRFDCAKALLLMPKTQKTNLDIEFLDHNMYFIEDQVRKDIKIFLNDIKTNTVLDQNDLYSEKSDVISLQSISSMFDAKCALLEGITRSYIKVQEEYFYYRKALVNILSSSTEIPVLYNIDAYYDINRSTNTFSQAREQYQTKVNQYAMGILMEVEKADYEQKQKIVQEIKTNTVSHPSIAQFAQTVPEALKEVRDNLTLDIKPYKIASAMSDPDPKQVAQNLFILKREAICQNKHLLRELIRSFSDTTILMKSEFQDTLQILQNTALTTLIKKYSIMNFNLDKMIELLRKCDNENQVNNKIREYNILLRQGIIVQKREFSDNGMVNEQQVSGLLVKQQAMLTKSVQMLKNSLSNKTDPATFNINWLNTIAQEINQKLCPLYINGYITVQTIKHILTTVFNAEFNKDSFTIYQERALLSTVITV